MSGVKAILDYRHNSGIFHGNQLTFFETDILDKWMDSSRTPENIQ